MNIGELAKESGVNAKLIRHYESIGLIPKATRSEGGYRQYNAQDVQFLRFIRRARGLGFSMKEIKQLLGLWKNKSRASADVKKLATRHLEELEQKIRSLQDIAEQLRLLARHCHGDGRPHCPILEELEN